MADVQELISQFEGLSPKIHQIIEGKDEQDQTIKDMSQQIFDLREEFKNFRVNGDENIKKVGNRWLWSDPASAKSFINFLGGIIQDKPADEIKAAAGMSEAVSADGGYLVPPEYATTIIRLIDVYGKIWGRATVLPMNRLEMKITTLSSGVTTYWVDEADAITESKPAFDQFTMTAYKLCALVPYTAELDSDAFLSLASYIAVLVAEAYAKEIDNIALLGDTGSGDKFDGLFVDSNITRRSMAAGKTTFSDVDADELLDLTSEVSEAAKVGAEYWMHPTVFDTCRKLKDSNGNYIVQHPTAGGPPTMWGYPVNTHDLLPSISQEDDSTIGDNPFVLFGNLKHFVIGDREDLSVAMSKELYFTTDQIAWRWKRRLSMKVALPAAFALLVPAS